MTDNFWKDLPKPFFALAPMEDVTDIAFRQVIAEASRPDVFFTEFTSAKAYNNPTPREHIAGRLAYDDSEQPIVAHIWGDQPTDFSKISVDLAQAAFKGVDLNMGCPVRNVSSKGRGAGLILQPKLAKEIIHASKEGQLPVSVKTRLGYHELSEMEDWLGHILEQDIANLTVHLRTKREMSDGQAHWDMIPKLVKLRDQIAPATLLTINGDITDRQMGQKLVDENPGVDGVMIGRGVFHNLFAFEKEPRSHTLYEYLDYLWLHLDFFDSYEDIIQRPFKTLRRSFKIYLRYFPETADLHRQLVKANSTEEARELLIQFEESL